jgi:hypothetical protein
VVERQVVSWHLKVQVSCGGELHIVFLRSTRLNDLIIYMISY